MMILKNLRSIFESYCKIYSAYYESCKRSDSSAMRDPDPVILLYLGDRGCSALPRI